MMKVNLNQLEEFSKKNIIKINYLGVNIYECLKENKLDNDYKYLLLISNTISTFILETILKELNRDSFFYLGSKLKDDVSKREYSYNMLNKIIVRFLIL